MGWGDVGKVLLESAPMIASLIPGGGPVVSMVASALGVDATPDAVQAKLADDPEAFAKIRMLEHAHRQRLEEISLEGEKAYLADVASARARDVEIQRDNSQNWRANILAGLAIASLILLIILLFRQAVPDSAENAVMYILGIVSGIVSQVYSFEFGSSQGSKNKEATMASNGRKK